ncbi:hypothetical protein BX600DRAFT_102089 [Xylariales sp. PMI_506]|nr:hypothetical protein BX600DRAFT_102089 [Xylariales sp. PMI_506]
MRELGVSSLWRHWFLFFTFFHRTAWRPVTNGRNPKPPLWQEYHQHHYSQLPRQSLTRQMGVSRHVFCEMSHAMASSARAQSSLRCYCCFYQVIEAFQRHLRQKYKGSLIISYDMLVFIPQETEENALKGLSSLQISSIRRS